MMNGGDHGKQVNFRNLNDTTINNNNNNNNNNNDDNNYNYNDDDNQTQMSIPSLHQSLMLCKKKNPYKYYDIIKLMGDGSMGSVSKVKKRKSAMGGSARKVNVQKEHADELCFGIKLPACFQFCNRNSSSGNTVIHMVEEGDEEETKPGGVLSVVDPAFAMSGVSGITIDEESSDLTYSTDSISAINFQSEASKKAQAHRNKKFNGSKNSSARSSQSARSRQSTMVSYGDKLVGSVYALKSIVIKHVKNPTFIQELQNEIAILRTVDHPNICKAIETYEYNSKLYLVLELCSGGDLYQRDPYDEQQAKYIVRSILNACAYLHHKNITHRDLKYENIMFAIPTSPNVKIIDFGLSTKYGKNEILNQTVSTVYTMAPEVIKGGGYDQQCDVWSIGVLAFMLCSSTLPFFGKTRQDIARRILHGRFKFNGRRWKNVSKEAKSFCRSLLVQDVMLRPNCVEALNHKWFHTDHSPRGCQIVSHDQDGTARPPSIGGCTRSGQVVSSVVMDRVQATVQMYAGYTSLKKLALYVIAYKSTVDEIGFLQQLFQNRFDVERDGIITLQEFKDALNVYSYTDEELTFMYNAVDIDGCGNISYSEFLAATIEAHGFIEEVRIAEAFDRLDSDDSGYITVNNLTAFLGKDIPESFIHKIIEEADVVDHDGQIDYDEFLGLWGSFDEDTLKRTILSVREKRLVRESAIELPPCDVNDTDDNDDNDNDDTVAKRVENC